MLGFSVCEQQEKIYISHINLLIEKKAGQHLNKYQGET